jgi:hypothetical protein
MNPMQAYLKALVANDSSSLPYAVGDKTAPARVLESEVRGAWLGAKGVWGTEDTGGW